MPRQSYSVPFAFAIGLIIGAGGPVKIETGPAVDVVHLADGRIVRHWKGAGDEDCRWEVTE